MKCITACFGSLTKHYGSKNKKHLIKPPTGKDKQSLSGKDASYATKEALLCLSQAAENTQIANSAIKGKDEDKFNSSTRKKVTFDLDANTSEPEECLEGKESLILLVESNGEGKKESQDEVGQGINCSGDDKGEEKEKRAKISDEADLISESSVSSLFSYPPNLRYQNCASSDEEDSVGMDFKESDLANDAESDEKNQEADSKNKDQNGSQDSALVPEESSESLFSLSVDSSERIAAFKESNEEIGSTKKDQNGSQETALVQDESSESLFSLSIDSRKQIAAVDTDMGEKEVSSPLKPPCKQQMNHENARERSNNVQSVLNPIENLSQWKVLKATKTNPPVSTTHQDKENLNLEQENDSFAFWQEPYFKKSSPELGSRRFSNRHKDDEITVDTSLSSWLMVSENNVTNENSPASVGNSSSNRTNTPKSLEGRQILGILSDKASSPPTKRSESQSPDEMPTIGTVGSYWRHTTDSNGADFGSSTMSKFCEKGSINSTSTPIQIRL